ncbi:MAG: diacylglycerol kinase family protein [Anaerolineales bacterium]
MACNFRDRIDSFKPAFAGFWQVWRTQPNARIHGAISIAIIVVGVWLQLSAASWALIVLAMGMVWVTEFLNTALEAVVDLASPRRHKIAKIAKDVSAAAVVIAALTAMIIGLLVLGRPLWERVSSLF